MPLSLVTAPTVEPLTLKQAKAYLNVDVDDDDVLIYALIIMVLLGPGAAAQFLKRLFG